MKNKTHYSKGAEKRREEGAKVKNLGKKKVKNPQLRIFILFISLILFSHFQTC